MRLAACGCRGPCRSLGDCVDSIFVVIWVHGIGRCRHFLYLDHPQQWLCTAIYYAKHLLPKPKFHSCRHTVLFATGPCVASPFDSLQREYSAMAPSNVPTRESVVAKVKTRFYFLCTVQFPRVPLANQEALSKQLC
jgi:hypothetical protein